MTMAEKIRNPEELKALQERVKGEIDPRTGPKDIRVTVHMGTCGIAAGARDVLGQLAEELTRARAANVTLRQSGCAGLCDQEPTFTVTDKSGQEFVYGKLDKAKVHHIVQQHVLNGTPVPEHLIKS